MHTRTRIGVSGVRRAAALALVLAGCAGSGQGLDANGDPIGTSAGAPLTADFASIQANVFTPICSVCHEGAAAPQGLRLDAADSYNLLVGVPSTEVSSIQRVRPGDPADSYLIQKLEGHASVGVRMPFGGPYLSGGQIAVIAQWITNGARPSAGSAAASPTATALVAQPALLASAPATNETLFEPPPQIMLGFDRDLGQVTADIMVVHVERSAADPGEAPIAVPVRSVITRENPRALLLWPCEPLPAGHYRVILGDGAYAGTAHTGRTAVEFDVEGSP